MKTKLLFALSCFVFVLPSCVPVQGTPAQQAAARKQNRETAAALGTFAGAVVDEISESRRDRRYGHGGHYYGPSIVPIVPVVPRTFLFY